MRYPPRLAHLATRQVIAAKLLESYAQVHHLDEEEAEERLLRALGTPLWEEVLAATWSALLGGTKRLDEAGLLEKVAQSLMDRPLRRGHLLKETTPGFSAFWVQVDLAAGTAGEAARRVMESEQGQRMAKMGFDEAGKFLAKELTRGK
jgi:hypothetical protein